MTLKEYEQNFNKIFAKRLKYYLNKNNMTQKDLAERLHVSVTSVGNWANGVKSPRMDKVDKMCEIFGCTRSDFVEDRSAEEEEKHYIDQEARELAQFLFENPEYRALFKATRDVKKDDLEFVKDLLDRFKSKD